MKENKKSNRRLITVSLLLLLISGLTISTTLAFLHSKTSVVTNTFIAKSGGKMFDLGEGETIDDKFYLDESFAKAQENGTYKLITETRKSANTYDIMPGMSIPKDPTIHLIDKTDIETYLYVEVVNNLGDNVTFEMADWFIPLLDEEGRGVKGENQGTIYVYGTSNGAKAFGTLDENYIKILKDDVVEVVDDAEKLAAIDPEKGITLSFYAYLAQSSVEDGDAYKIYETCFIPN